MSAAPSASSPSAPAATPRRPGTAAWLLLAAIIALATLLAPLLATPAPAHAEPPTSVTVEDTVGAVDAQALTAELEGLDFRRPVDLHALLLDVRELGLDPADDRALNDAVLAHARQEAPQLLSPDGDHFADGIVLLAIDPEGRFLGTYAGEDVKLSEGGFESVQDDMRDPAADGQWQRAVVEGADSYATLLGRPWWQHPGAIAAAVVAAAALLAALVGILVGRRDARRRTDQSRSSYEDVMATRRLTDTAARNLPPHSPYTPAAVSDHERYSAQLARAEQLHEQLPLPRERGWGWGLRGSQRRLARDYRATVSELDDLDDDIIATHDLLHRIGDWREAWEREVEPLRDAVAALDEILELPGGAPAAAQPPAREADFTSGPAPEDTSAELQSRGARITTEISELTAALEADAITPDAALDRLDELTALLSGSIAALRDQTVDALAEDEEEADLMREIDVDLADGDAPQYRSVRGRRHARQLEPEGRWPGAPWQLNPVLWYTIWSSESHSQLESHRNPSAGSAGTSSFSGGFSGAGSSGRF